MEPKISATVLVIFVLLGVSANTAIYAQAQPTIITPHSSSKVEPISSPTNAMIDLNNPVSLDTNANVNTEISSNTTAFSTTFK